MAALERTVGIAPERILAVSDEALRDVVAGIRPDERVARLRRCAELALADSCPAAGTPPRLY